MTGDLSTPTHLRALVEALPEPVQARWETIEPRRVLVGVPIRDGGSSFYAVAMPNFEYGGAEDRAIGAFIAAMGPPVVLALADLLDEIAKHDQADDPHDWETCFIAVRHAADALEAAIHRTPEGAA